MAKIFKLSVLSYGNATTSISSCLFRIKHKVKVLLLIVCGLFSQLLPSDEVITLRQVGGALGAVLQLWSIKLEIPSSSVLGLQVCVHMNMSIQNLGSSMCVCVCV